MTEKSKIAESYPEWLIINGFGGWFDKQDGIYTTFERFLEIATLHDSYWVGLFNYIDNSANIILIFDAFWNQDIAKHPGSKVKDWPYLIINLEKVHNIIFNSNLDCGITIGDVKTELVNDNQKEIFIDSFAKQKILNQKLAENLIDSKVVKTRIEDVCGGFIEILHNEIIRVRLYDSDGNQIDFPDEMKVLKNE